MRSGISIWPAGQVRMKRDMRYEISKSRKSNLLSQKSNRCTRGRKMNRSSHARHGPAGMTGRTIAMITSTICPTSTRSDPDRYLYRGNTTRGGLNLVRGGQERSEVPSDAAVLTWRPEQSGARKHNESWPKLCTRMI